MERERQEFKYDLVKMNELKKDGTIPEMQMSVDLEKSCKQRKKK